MLYVCGGGYGRPKEGEIIPEGEKRLGWLAGKHDTPLASVWSDTAGQWRVCVVACVCVRGGGRPPRLPT